MLGRFLLYIWLAIIYSDNSLVYALQCKGQNNEDLDWYVIYKLPKQTSKSNAHIKEGLGYVYMTSKNYTEWTWSEVSINDSNSMVGHSLKGLFEKKNEKAYILYNDEAPNGKTSGSKGHTKGVVLADSISGLWLIHSVPHFPYSSDHYEYPTTGQHYGQSFLCISLNLKQINNVGKQLQYNEPFIFSEYVPTSLSDTLPDIVRAANNETINASPYYNIETIISLAGIKITSFAKSAKFGKDLYSNLVNSELTSNLYVETWPNEANRLPSDCTNKYQVDNIKIIQMSNPSVSFKATVDHSKWAVSTPSDLNQWVCIGDINRAQKQTERGGGTTCLNNEKLSGVYQKIISSVEPCSNKYYYDINDIYNFL
ncbi:plancitoxin-1 [Anthonomus grandis grandis]|uniref:plancitoxin-1 n=1 Tax=Anthonomus grandis grandis TaxID=2921223 RepID=UPI002165E7DF|nr:plancitoxin-1 [Anthonomus grandis grandis]